MKLATIRTPGGSVAVRIDGEHAVELGAPDVGSLLAEPDWRTTAGETGGRRFATADVEYAPVVVNPSKIICVGLNYRTHILEMGRELPTYPTLFAKFVDSLLGAHDDIALPDVSDEVDWEAELAVIVGRSARHVTPAQAASAIAGYTVLNDISMRDWQWRTVEWLQGKAFEASTPVGPWLVTPDEVDDAADLAITCEVNGEVMQSSRTSDLLFRPADLVSYISRFTTLRAGDMIATGTPGGVGAARDPKTFLTDGDVVRTVIDGLGPCVNRCVKEGTS